MAKDNKKIVSVKASNVGFVILYFSATSLKPGAIIELASGETNV
jgi:hypothetical protein